MRGLANGSENLYQDCGLSFARFPSSIRFDAVQRGELAQLTSAEATDAAPLLHGDAAMAAFYINELCLRLAPRQDPQSELHAARRHDDQLHVDCT